MSTFLAERSSVLDKPAQRKGVLDGMASRTEA